MRMMHVLESQGKVKPGTAAEFDVGGAAYKKLPEKAPKAKATRKR